MHFRFWHNIYFFKILLNNNPDCDGWDWLVYADIFLQVSAVHRFSQDHRAVFIRISGIGVLVICQVLTCVINIEDFGLSVGGLISVLDVASEKQLLHYGNKMFFDVSSNYELFWLSKSRHGQLVWNGTGSKYRDSKPILLVNKLNSSHSCNINMLWLTLMRLEAYIVLLHWTVVFHWSICSTILVFTITLHLMKRFGWYWLMFTLNSLHASGEN